MRTLHSNGDGIRGGSPINSYAVRVAFDPQTFSLQDYGGVSRYFVETATCLFYEKLAAPMTDQR